MKKRIFALIMVLALCIGAMPLTAYGETPRNECQHPDAELYDRVDPTCTEAGHEAYYYCAECDSYLNENKELQEYDNEKYSYALSDFQLLPLGHHYVNGVCENDDSHTAKTYELVTVSDDLEIGGTYIIYVPGQGVMAYSGPEDLTVCGYSETSGAIVIDNSSDPAGVYALEFTLGEFVPEDQQMTLPQDDTPLYTLVSDSNNVLMPEDQPRAPYLEDSHAKYPLGVSVNNENNAEIRTWNYGEWGDFITFQEMDNIPGFVTSQTSNIQLMKAVTPHEHVWGDPEYEWSADYTTVTAIRVCEEDDTHIETETAEVSDDLTEATCETPGKHVYTVVFDNTAFEQQTTEVAIAQLPHVIDTVAGIQYDETGHWYLCANCSTALDQNGEVGSEEHTFEDYETIKEATTTEPGIKMVRCTVCDYMTEQEIPVLDDQGQGGVDSGDDPGQDDPHQDDPPAPVYGDDDDDDDVSAPAPQPGTAYISNYDVSEADPVNQNYSWYGRSDVEGYSQNMYTVLADGTGNPETETGSVLADPDNYDLPSEDGEEVPGQTIGDDGVMEADYVAPTYLEGEAPATPASIIQAGSISGSEFYAVNPSKADKSINYANLKPGDVVRTTAYNGIYITSLDKNSKTYEADSKTVKSNIFASFVAFDLDHPEVFWLTGSTKVRVTTVTKGGKSTSYYFLVLVDDKGFCMRQADYAKDGSIEEAIKVRDEAAQKIIATVPTDAGIKEKVQALNKWLTLNNEYNRTQDLSTIGFKPHRALSALTGNTGTAGPVCDGYARAFKLLCDRIGIPCVLQSGWAFSAPGTQGENHMWNQVQTEDGNWYGVDICWDDPVVKDVSAAMSGKENENWLFAGAETVINGLKFGDSHQVQMQTDGDANYFSSLNIYLSGLDAAFTEGYGDVGLGDWFYEVVKDVTAKKLMEGNAGNFSPYAQATRAQAAAVLYRLAGNPAVSGDMPFSDIPSNAWYRDAVLWASQNGISDGVGGGRFNPDGKITREQLVTMLYRYAQKSGAAAGGISGLDKFVDKASVSGYAVEPFAWAVETGCIDGKTGSRLAPSDIAKRAELAAVLSRFTAE